MTPFNLTEFKRLAEARTKGDWNIGLQWNNPGNVCGEMEMDREDAEFIAYCGTHADAIIQRLEKLEAVAHIAKQYKQLREHPNWVLALDALKALEEK